MEYIYCQDQKKSLFLKQGDISSRTSLFESNKRNGVRHRSLNRINHIRNDSHLNQVPFFFESKRK